MAGTTSHGRVKRQTHFAVHRPPSRIKTGRICTWKLPRRDSSSTRADSAKPSETRNRRTFCPCPVARWPAAMRTSRSRAGLFRASPPRCPRSPPALLACPACLPSRPLTQAKAQGGKLVVARCSLPFARPTPLPSSSITTLDGDAVRASDLTKSGRLHRRARTLTRADSSSSAVFLPTTHTHTHSVCLF